jgi:hypothetical protein
MYRRNGFGLVDRAIQQANSKYNEETQPKKGTSISKQIRQNYILESKSKGSQKSTVGLRLQSRISVLISMKDKSPHF